MISRLFLLLSVMLAAASAHAQTQPFEGTVQYRVTVAYTDPVRQAKYNKRDLVLGTQETMITQGANASVSTAGLTISRYLYRHAERRRYTYFHHRPQVMWYDLGKPAPKLLSRQLQPAADTVLGVVCDVVELRTDDYTLRAAVHPQYRGRVAETSLPDSLLFRAVQYPSGQTLVLRSVEKHKNGDITRREATKVEPHGVAADARFAAPPAGPDLLPDWFMLDKAMTDSELARFGSFMGSNIKYPKKAIEAGIEGTVVLEFMVTEDRRIADIRVVQAVEPTLDAEAVRVLQQFAKWQPRTYQGKPVRSIFSVPVTYRLE